jgi:GT2 family glycosyltransferase
MNDSRMDVTVIIVNYNTTLLTTQCINSVYTHCRSNIFEIILIDNNSADRGIENITYQFPDLTLILNKENKGFGRANNQGIAIAKGEFVFLLNSDTLLHSDAIGFFVNYLRQPSHKKIAVCGGELLDTEGKPATSFGNFPGLFQLVSSLGFSYFYRSYYRRHLDTGVANYDETIKEVNYVSGAAMMIRVSVLKEVGAFDEDFFLFFEETELSYRIVKAGYKSVIIPEVKITHYEGGSSESSYKNYVRSRQLYYKKTYGYLAAYIAKPLYLCQMVLRSIARKEKSNNFWYRFWVLLKA